MSTARVPLVSGTMGFAIRSDNTVFIIFKATEKAGYTQISQWTLQMVCHDKKSRYATLDNQLPMSYI